MAEPELKSRSIYLTPNTTKFFSYHKVSLKSYEDNADELQKLYAKWKKPDAKGYIPYDSIYMKYPE